jgi:hypothetical protein
VNQWPTGRFEGMLASMPHLFAVTRLLLGASLVLGACAGRSSSHDEGDGGTGNTSGTTASGGSSGAADNKGGSSGAADNKGGSTASGGSSASGPTGGSDVGGTTDPGIGGTGVGGTTGKAGTGGTLNCANVSCPSIPNSCKKLVQPPDECCPVCLDTGCQEECTDPGCKEGEHLETIPGDCCPTCAADPPDACATGQEIYANLKDALIEKYGSSGCKNSSECTIVYEYNACASTCGVPLPSSTAQSYSDNLNNYAAGCETCPQPPPILCPAAAAACLNGKCVITSP